MNILQVTKLSLMYVKKANKTQINWGVSSIMTSFSRISHTETIYYNTAIFHFTINMISLKPQKQRQVTELCKETPDSYNKGIFSLDSSLSLGLKRNKNQVTR